jgi:hypothetical protein
VKFVGAGIRRLTVEAVHPAYIRALRKDHMAADFTNCPDMSQNRSYTFTPKTVTLYEDLDYALVGHTFRQFWRPESVDFHVGAVVTHDLHLVQLIRKIGGHRIEILVVYPSDGYWRAKPLPPPNLAQTGYGSSFLIGPVEEDGRPFVPISSIRFVRSDLSFRLRFKQGKGSLRVMKASAETTRLGISLPPLPGVVVFAALRSMFVSPSVADTAVAQLTLKEGDRRNLPVLDFTGANATSVTFARPAPSRHNTSAPDLRFEAFKR